MQRVTKRFTGQTKRVKFRQNKPENKNSCKRKKTLHNGKMANPSRRCDNFQINSVIVVALSSLFYRFRKLVSKHQSADVLSTIMCCLQQKQNQPFSALIGINILKMKKRSFFYIDSESLVNLQPVYASHLFSSGKGYTKCTNQNIQAKNCKP